MILNPENPTNSNNTLKKEEILRSAIGFAGRCPDVLHVDVTAFEFALNVKIFQERNV